MEIIMGVAIITVMVIAIKHAHKVGWQEGWADNLAGPGRESLWAENIQLKAQLTETETTLVAARSRAEDLQGRVTMAASILTGGEE